ncbi:MAG: hypothetical protein EPO08_20590 [Rhodospirillaceae bacterium]|nr:MAG: hypothetical protein EPO08_20590 [Rhodospirillaceae bacterium]
MADPLDLRAPPRLPAQGDVQVEVANQVIEVKISTNIKQIAFRSIGAIGLVSFDPNLVNNGPLGTSKYSMLPANNLITLPAGMDPSSGALPVASYFVTSATVGTRIEVIVGGVVG